MHRSVSPARYSELSRSAHRHLRLGAPDPGLERQPPEPAVRPRRREMAGQPRPALPLTWLMLLSRLPTSADGEKVRCLVRGDGKLGGSEPARDPSGEVGELGDAGASLVTAGLSET